MDLTKGLEAKYHVIAFFDRDSRDYPPFQRIYLPDSIEDLTNFCIAVRAIWMLDDVIYTLSSKGIHLDMDEDFTNIEGVDATILSWIRLIDELNYGIYLTIISDNCIQYYELTDDEKAIAKRVYDHIAKKLSSESCKGFDPNMEYDEDTN